MTPHPQLAWTGALWILVANTPTQPPDGSISGARLGDPITNDDVPVSIGIDVPYLWIAAAPQQYTSGFVQVCGFGAQFSRHIAP